MILPCKCAHEFQDARHGSHKRVHNPIKICPDVDQEYRCTVCGSVKTKDQAKKEALKLKG